jgi:hypothetical protein
VGPKRIEGSSTVATVDLNLDSMVELGALLVEPQRAPRLRAMLDRARGL